MVAPSDGPTTYEEGKGRTIYLPSDGMRACLAEKKQLPDSTSYLIEIVLWQADVQSVDELAVELQALTTSVSMPIC